MVDDKTRAKAIDKIAEALDLHFGSKPTAHHRLARGIWDTVEQEVLSPANVPATETA